MLEKKSPEANLERKKTTALLLGLVLALSGVYIALEWSKSDLEVFTVIETVDPGFIEIEIPITKEPEPTPPPPPAIVEQIIEIINQVPDDVDTQDIVIAGGEELGNEIIFQKPVDIDEEPPIVDFLPNEDMPKFIGNLNEFLSKNIRYPSIPAENGIQGRVVCQFVVNRDGQITDIKVLRSIDPLLDKEAVRVIQSMPAWKPGVQQGKPVSVRYTLPINFRLQ